MGGSDEIIELARRSGIPNKPGSTHRPGAVTASGSPSWHASDNAVDFTGRNQDRLAQYFMGIPTMEVIHHSDATGHNYATSEGKPFELRGPLLQQHRDHLHVAMTESQARKALGVASGAAAGVGGFMAGADIAGLPPLPFLNPGTSMQALTNIGQGMQNLATGAARVGELAGLVSRIFLPSNAIRAVALFFGIVFILIGILFLAREVRQS